MTKGWIRIILAMGSLAVVSACDSDTAVQTSLSTAPTRPAFTGSMVFVPTVVLSTPVAFSCVPVAFTTNSTFDLVITSSTVVDVDQVTFRLIDGTNVGGRTITVPSSQLNAQFGSTRVAAGATRVFPFQSQLLCSSILFTSFAADVVFVDATGMRQTVTVSSTVTR